MIFYCILKSKAKMSGPSEIDEDKQIQEEFKVRISFCMEQC